MTDNPTRTRYIADNPIINDNLIHTPGYGEPGWFLHIERWNKHGIKVETPAGIFLLAVNDLSDLITEYLVGTPDDIDAALRVGAWYIERGLMLPRLFTTEEAAAIINEARAQERKRLVAYLQHHKAVMLCPTCNWEWCYLNPSGFSHAARALDTHLWEAHQETL